jgi:hypothetical protein
MGSLIIARGCVGLLECAEATAVRRNPSNVRTALTARRDFRNIGLHDCEAERGECEIYKKFTKNILVQESGR